MNSNIVYVNAFQDVDYCRCYLNHYFSTTKDKALQDSCCVNSNLVYLNVFWVIDFCRCYLNYYFSSTKDEALQDS
ncbi:hypothetical protein JHK84_050520 [Glycine max]|nr:hypothetical protein JHK84_050520 [Glycine max]